MTETISLKELEKLLKVCNINGVTSLEYRGLKISMGATVNLPMTPAPQARGSAKKAKQINEKAELQTQFDHAQHMVETLHVEDPSAYEDLLLQGELGEEREKD